MKCDNWTFDMLLLIWSFITESIYIYYEKVIQTLNSVCPIKRHHRTNLDHCWLLFGGRTYQIFTVRTKCNILVVLLSFYFSTCQLQIDVRYKLMGILRVESWNVSTFILLTKIQTNTLQLHYIASFRVPHLTVNFKKQHFWTIFQFNLT